MASATTKRGKVATKSGQKVSRTSTYIPPDVVNIIELVPAKLVNTVREEVKLANEDKKERGRTRVARTLLSSSCVDDKSEIRELVAEVDLSEDEPTITIRSNGNRYGGSIYEIPLSAMKDFVRKTDEVINVLAKQAKAPKLRAADVPSIKISVECPRKEALCYDHIRETELANGLSNTTTLAEFLSSWIQKKWQAFNLGDGADSYYRYHSGRKPVGSLLTTGFYCEQDRRPYGTRQTDLVEFVIVPSDKNDCDKYFADLKEMLDKIDSRLTLNIIKSWEQNVAQTDKDGVSQLQAVQT